MGATPVPAGHKGAAYGSAVRSHAPQGGQASDQANKRKVRPAPAHSPGQLITKTPGNRGQQDPESQASTTCASLTISPDDTSDTLTARPDCRVRCVRPRAARSFGWRQTDPAPSSSTRLDLVDHAGNAALWQHDARLGERSGMSLDRADFYCRRAAGDSPSASYLEAASFSA